jgi:hypothetical protein
MNYKEIVVELRSSNKPLDLFGQLAVSPKKKVKSKEIASWIDDVRDAVKRNKKPQALATARTIFLMAGAKEGILQIKREGLLRLSEYAFNAPLLTNLVDDWIRNAGVYGIDQFDLEYLESVKLLYSLGGDLRALYLHMVKTLRENRAWALKTLLAEADSVYCFGHSDRSKALGLSDSISPEEVIEAFSYLLSVFHAQFGVTEQAFALVDPNVGYAQEYFYLLDKAAIICQYRETEIKLESFQYRAERKAEVVEISASDPAVEQSIRNGYIQAEMQVAVRVQLLQDEVKKKRFASLNDTATRLFESIGDHVVQLKEKPTPRYVMTLPIIEQVATLFSGDELYIEEIAQLDMLSNEDYVEPDDIGQVSIVGNITVIDILKVQRTLRFLHKGMLRAIASHQPFSERIHIALVSSLPVFSDAKLKEIFELVIGKDKALEMLDLLSVNLSEKYVDFQYTPILRSGGKSMLSLAIFCGSNLVRNLLCHYCERLTLRNGEEDPMQSSLKVALQEAGFLVEAEVVTGTKNDEKEVDIFAYKDGNLFLIECKNTYHPCNVYELRTTYNHIKKAAGQLTIRQEWLTEPDRQRAVYKRLGWEVEPTKDVHTCVAVGNRTFTGYVLNGHPVRQVHEMLNVLLRGTVKLNEKVFRIWNGEQFAVNDLLTYLGPNGITSDFMRSFDDDIRVFVTGSNVLKLATYYLNPEKLFDIVHRRYAPITDPMIGQNH